jgi:hypothetical protein
MYRLDVTISARPMHRMDVGTFMCSRAVDKHCMYVGGMVVEV